MVRTELTLAQAAEMLNESDDEMEALLAEGEIPFIQCGQERKVRTEDVLRYKRVRYERRQKGLRELARLTELYGGYEREMT